MATNQPKSGPHKKDDPIGALCTDFSDGVKARVAARRKQSILIKKIWPTKVEDSDPKAAEERQRWRRAMATCAQELIQNARGQNHQSVYIKEIDAMARACTLANPSYTGVNAVIPLSRRWTGATQREQEAFVHTRCSKEDRQEYLQWLGRFVGRSNWYSKGRGSAPMATAAAARVILQWLSMAWRGKEVPEWCANEVTIIDQSVYLGPSDKETKIYRAWNEGRADMHVFLEAWKLEHSAAEAKRSRPRRVLIAYNPAAADMITHAFLLRALEASHPGTLDDGDVLTIKSMTKAICESPALTELMTLVEVLEERRYLENGLAKIPAGGKTKNGGLTQSPDAQSVRAAPLRARKL